LTVDLLWAWPCKKIPLFFIHHCAKFHSNLLISSLIIWIHNLTFTFDFDLNNDLVNRCVAYLSMMVPSLIAKYASILFLWIVTCLAWHKYGRRDLDLWDMNMKHQSDYHPCFTKYSHWLWGRSNGSWFLKWIFKDILNLQ
jgi:hypothetical protein